MNVRKVLKKPSVVILLIVLIIGVSLALLSYRQVIGPQAQVVPSVTKTVSSLPTLTPTPKVSPTAVLSGTPMLTLLPPQDPSKILGIDASPSDKYPGINWVRMGYPTCGWGDQRGTVLRDTIQSYHKRGIRVLLTLCQPSSQQLYDTNLLNDAAQGHPDAVQCGNEQMKQDPSVAFLYVPPANFARFYDLCEHAVHAVNPDTPVLLGSLDPHVGGVDYQPLLDQVNYLDQMQDAMNSSVHPGGNWDWHTKTLGLIDSWHNGYPDASVNSLYGLFLFWSQQFRVDLNSGQLGKHLWVVEGTGCFKGCGVPDTAYGVAVSHILTLITDVQTAMKYTVPLFYFSGKDFQDQGVSWPIGVLDQGGHSKPIRQDLSMGSRTLTLSCSNGSVTVPDQEQLLAKLYSGCALPANYTSSIW
ncbi:MAG TPA: hypothetical protein VFB12_03710 [Ktedonobacteraceae bacterium]|nr:hypothetical protein [Ktedonobacteraceae bacterium]